VQTKLFVYATALEGAAWVGALLAQDSGTAFLSFMLLHGAAAVLFALAAAAWLAPGARRARLALLPLCVALLFSLPGVGVVLVPAWLLSLRRMRARAHRAPFGQVEVPPFDVHLGGRLPFRFAGAAGILANPRVPVHTRVGALLALSRMSGRVATPLLRSVLTCSNEDVRLLAYGLLDAREKRLNEAIQAALTRHRAAGPDRGDAAAQLAQLYWELVYHGLAVGDVRRHALERCLAYAEEALAAGQSEMALYRARALHALGRLAEVAEAYAALRGVPPSRVLPYAAELAYDQGDYATMRALLSRLTPDASLHRLAAVLRYWRAA
jgi:hypothetical protein